jgi:nucleotide-binding universal stress UspA family protein
VFKRILVPLDGSELAERVLPHVMRFAKVFDARIILLRVLDSGSLEEQHSVTEPLNWQIRKAEADVKLQNTAAALRGKGYDVEAHLREGKAPENIIDFAHSEEIDLLAITTHGASGMSRWSNNSVVHKVLSKVYLPVLLVRAYQHPMVQEDGQVAYRSILMPIDTSRRAECALPAAAALARGDTRLVLAAVIQPPALPIPTPYPEEINQLTEQFMKVSREAISAYLEEQRGRMPSEAETRIVENPSIPAAIHDLTRKEDVDLVVLCAHGQTGGMGWPYGSVAGNFIEHGERCALIIQDIPLSQAPHTAAEAAMEIVGRR